MTVIAEGIEAHNDYLAILREHVGELAANSMEYEEQDRRAEPLTTTLIVSIVVTTVITTTLSEVIKTIIKKLSDTSEKKSTVPSITVTINKTNYSLPQDRVLILERVDTLTRS